MFDADEAASTVLALRAYAGAPADSASGSVLSALDKLIGVMPTRLRATVAAVSDHSSSLHLGMPVGARPVPVDVRSLVTPARACREHRQVSALYRSRLGAARRRQLEPLHLVGTMGRWYLVAYCPAADGWRTFRVDRMSEIETASTPIGLARRRRPTSTPTCARASARGTAR
jgi:predicted DNA-binding transcriptional regulator YafY